MVRILSTSIVPWLLFLSLHLRHYGVIAQTTAIDTSLGKESGFIGWYMGPHTTQALTDPETWTTSGNYARGCPKTGSCAYATACQNNSITYDNGQTATCNQCRTMTIFETVPYGTPSASNIFCAGYWVAFTVFRQLPATTTSSESITSSVSPSNSFATATAMTRSTAAVASATPSQEEALEKPVQSSKAWIAGAVLGPVLGVLAAGIVFWCLQRRQAKAGQFNQPGLFLAGMSSRRQDFSPAQEMDSVAYPRVHELSSYK